MDRSRVRAWVAAYERCWRAGDLDGLATIFTEEAEYLASPYEEPEVGLDAIRAFWLEDEGKTFSMKAETIAVEGRRAVVRVEVRYGNPKPQEYRDLWVLRFALDGRVEHFEEWAYWPGRPFNAAAE